MIKKFEDFEKEANLYKQILINYRDKGDSFCDPNFNPLANIPESDIIPTGLGWMRIDDIYPAPLFQQDLISPNAIQQSELNNCALISALVQLSRQPFLVPYLFDHQADSILGEEKDSINIKCGAVVIYFHAFGRKTPVLIDTLIPTIRPNSKRPKFVDLTDETKSPWFLLVEKAYAKLHGSYSATIGGNFVQAIYSLYGYYSARNKDMNDIKKSSKRKPFKYLLKYQKEKAIMSVSAVVYADGPVTLKDLEEKGLFPSHSYLVIQLKKYEGKNFIQLQNPWHESKWSGDWSRASNLWTPKMKNDFNLSEIDDGTFWMIESDFFHFFSIIEICKIPKTSWKKRHLKYTIKASSQKRKLSEYPRFCYQITDDSPDDEIYIHLIAERRHSYLDDNGKINPHPPNFCIPIHLPGMTLHFESAAKVISVYKNVRKRENPYEFIVYHSDTCPYDEDVYITVYSEYNFKLFHKETPDVLIPEDTRDDPFDNFGTLDKCSLMSFNHEQSDKNVQNDSNEIKVKSRCCLLV